MIWRKLRYLLPGRRRAADRDIQEELDALRDLAGSEPLGNLTLAAEDARAVLGWSWLDRLGQDVRYALRSMRRQKAFTLLVVASLALGIGANTAIFSFLEAVLLRPLPVRDPDALVVMKWRAREYTLAKRISWSTGGSWTDASTGVLSSGFPHAALDVFQRASDVVEHAFGYFVISGLAVSVDGETEPVVGQYVSGRYFAGMGVVPAAGRLLDVDDDRIGAAGVAVLSYRFSVRRFGAASAAVGRTVRLNDKPFLVVGVAPAGFFGAEPASVADVFVPMHADMILGSTEAAARRYADPHYYWIDIMARLRPGVSVDEAQAALAPRFRQFVEATATTDEERQDLPSLRVQSGAGGLDSLRHDYVQPIAILMTLVGVILLIACANIAGLLLSRATARRQEIAIRLGIGASRGRIVRQLLTESVVLASIGGGLGIAVAWWGIHALTRLVATGRDNFTLHAELNSTVLGVTAALSLATGLLFGLVPALRATRVAIAPSLKAVRAGESPTRRRRFTFGRPLVVVQLVLSLVLLIAAGLFGRTLATLRAIDLGFDGNRVLLFSIRPSAIGYSGPDLGAVFERVRNELSRLPGVQNVSLSVRPLPMGGGTVAPIGIAGLDPPPAPDGRPPRAVLTSVGSGFFTTMRIPIAGRDFSDRDNPAAPAVAIVNRGVAEMFGLANPIGRTLTIQDDRWEIVGVADDAVAFTIKEEKWPIVYLSYLQSERPVGSMTYAVRTAGPPLALAGAVRHAVQQVDPRLALYDLETQAAHIDQAISTEILMARLSTAFAGLALVIACVGVYGTIAFGVVRRTSEIGIRMTLGARGGAIVWMVLKEVLIATAVGLAIGIPLALFGSRYVASLLYGITPHDPMAIAGSVAVLLVCSLAAGAVPARRASRIDPLLAVRHE